MIRLLPLALFALLVAAPALANPDYPEVGNYTGRPGQSEPSVTVPRGYMLVNGSFVLSRSGGEGLFALEDTTWTAPDMQVRAGVLDILELRGGTGLVASRASDGDLQLQLGGPLVGVGVSALPETEWLPAIAVHSVLFLPGATLDALDMAGEVRASISKGFGAFGLTTNLAGGWDNGRGQSFFNYTLAGAWAAGGGTNLFVEAYGGMDVLPNPTLPSVGFDTGVAVQVSKTLMLDVYFGGTVIGPPEIFLNIGGSWMPGTVH